jgi:sporulation protein YlmC with PRC-barrel domain
MHTKPHIRLIFTVVSAVAAPLAVHGQAQTPATAAAVQRSHDRAERPANDPTIAEALKGKDQRVSKLIGKKVVSTKGETLGKVEDLLEQPGKDQNPIVVIGVGGVLGVGEKWHASTFDELGVRDDELVLNKSIDELKSEPTFHYVPRAGEKSAQGGATGPGTTNSIGSLLGATVVDASGKSIGEIDDLVVSAEKDGTRAIVELNSEAGRDANGRLVAVPYDRIHLERSGEEAKGIPQQPRVRADFGRTPLDELKPYAYPYRQPI